MSPPTDEAELIAAAIGGNDTAFGELVRHYQGSLRGLLRRMTADTSLADDLAQEAFVLAWQKLSGFRGGSFRSWLATIATRRWLRYLRDAPPPARESVDAIEGHAAENVGQRMDIDRALACLSADQRLAVLLSFTVGMSHAEIGQVTGWPLGTVKSHVSRGKQRLYHHLDGYDHAAQ